MAYPGIALVAMIGVGLGLALWYLLADTTPEGAHTAGPQSQRRDSTSSASWERPNVTRRRRPRNNLEECPICTEQMDNLAETVRCGHVYHRACIKKWREVNIEAQGGDPRSSVTCPLCRQSI